LCQRDGYALCHNLGAGHVIFTREAARLTLNNYRSHWTTGTARVFHALSGIDIRRYWCFGGAQQMTTVDWGFDAILAAHGLASLALTPSPCEMIGQDPAIADQMPTLVTDPVELLRDDAAFRLFAERTNEIRRFRRALPDQRFCRTDDGGKIIFPHQIGAVGGQWYGLGEWSFKWQQGFGPFAYVAEPRTPFSCYIDVPLIGPCTFMASGGKSGARVRVTDTQSGYEIETDLNAEGEHSQVTNLAVPGSIAYRTVRLTALSPGLTFYGVQVGEPQVTDPTWTFDHSVLPKP
jgi:hypothetical protein